MSLRIFGEWSTICERVCLVFCALLDVKARDVLVDSRENGLTEKKLPFYSKQNVKTTQKDLLKLFL